MRLGRKSLKRMCTSLYPFPSIGAEMMDLAVFSPDRISRGDLRKGVSVRCWSNITLRDKALDLNCRSFIRLVFCTVYYISAISLLCLKTLLAQSPYNYYNVRNTTILHDLAKDIYDVIRCTNRSVMTTSRTIICPRLKCLEIVVHR